MPQVFISYSRADKRRVTKLVAAFRKLGHDIWWDQDIPAGANWEQTIEKALSDAGAVIVCWSSVSVLSESVRSEARAARSANKLVQVFLDPCEPPLFFGERQGLEVSGWTGSARDPRTTRLQAAIDAAFVRDTTNNSSAAAARRRRPFLPGRALTATVFGMILLVMAGWFWVTRNGSSSSSRVAVQPIKALNADATVADSLTDQIITALNDGHIPTISKSAGQILAGSNGNREIRSLGVGYLIGGTLERSGQSLHARLHLDDLRKHQSLWSFELSDTADNSAALNSSIARAIAGVVSCAYRAIGPGGLTDTELLSRYLRVCDLFVNHDDATDFKSAFELFDDLRMIMAKAPTFAPAQSDFAKFAAYLAPVLPAEQAAPLRAEATRAARRAIELDPHSADAYVAREMMLQPTDWAQREALLRKAVSVDPKWPHSNGFLAMFLVETGRIREAAIYGQRAAAADLQIDWKPYGARMACDAGETASTITDLRQRLANAPSDEASKWALRWCLLDAGMARDAEAITSTTKTQFGIFRSAVQTALISNSPEDRDRAKRLAEQLPINPDTARSAIPLVAVIGDVETAFKLADTISPGYPTNGIIDFLFIPQTESMRRDPRFFDLAKRFGLADFWAATGRWPDFCIGARMPECRASSTRGSAR
jgi:TolB-like protein